MVTLFGCFCLATLLAGSRLLVITSLPACLHLPTFVARLFVPLLRRLALRLRPLAHHVPELPEAQLVVARLVKFLESCLDLPLVQILAHFLELLVNKQNYFLEGIVMEQQYIVGSLCTQTPSAACGLWRANLINILYENRYIWRNGDMEKGKVENMLQISSSAASYCFPLNSPWWANNVREDGILLHVPSIYLPFPEY